MIILPLAASGWFIALFCDGFVSRLQDGEEGGEEGDFDPGDGGVAEETVFDLGDELEVGGFVGGGGAKGDAGEVADGEAGDGGAIKIWRGGVGGEGGGLD